MCHLANDSFVDLKTPLNRVDIGTLLLAYNVRHTT